MDNIANNWNSDLLIVIVIYNIKLENSPSFISLSKEMNDATFFIYDNSTQLQSVNSDPSKKIIVKHNSKNPGVSKAYNEAHRFALANGKKWIMLCDQDTLFSSNIQMRFNYVVSNHPTQELFVPILKDDFGIVSPFKFKWGRGTRIKNAVPGKYALKDFKFINSGSLISTSLFAKCKGYDERFPLDFSDLAFIKRAMDHQQEFILVDTICKHQLSSSTNSLSQALSRFKVFSTSSAIYGKEYGTKPLQWGQALLRAIKLSIQFKNIQFLYIFFRN